MVKPQLPLICMLILVFSAGIMQAAEAQTLEYHLDHEWVRIRINKDSTIDLFYDIQITCDSGTLHWVEVGQPNHDFTIGKAYDENNHQLPATDTSGPGDYKVRVDLVDLNAGQSIRFNLTTNVGRMIWQDTTNEGNVGLQFTPSWFPVEIGNLRLRIVTPTGVNQTNLKTLTGMPWNSSDYNDGPFAVYWERFSLAPDQKYTFGVSFPAQFVDRYEIAPGWLETYGSWIVVFVVLSLIIAIIAITLKKKPYLIPKISMETLGVRRGLAAVEASYLLDMAPGKIVTEILYSLLHKRAVWVTGTKPSVTLKVMEQPTSTPETGQQADTPLRYYEKDFLEAIRKDGTLDETKLAHTVTLLEQSVEDKLRGYCRKDTIDYYTRIVQKAWEQVTQAGTAELASKAYDGQLLWLLLDPDNRAKTETAFKDRAFEPTPLWWWYWYSYRQYYPKPTYEPNVNIPAQSGPAPKIPGADFANNIATAVEKTSNNIVANLEKFANSIVPAAQQAKTSHQPARDGAKCVCACAACACACACVSCACACAGGGAG
jgi:hypothetical protein